mmetsp:Transcript_16484/g.38112  ORF Transcript_16484/g.38112 Transcript_16484/m.38112 type:complete len:516 (+) Transcript_16484:72-1619(+)
MTTTVNQSTAAASMRIFVFLTVTLSMIAIASSDKQPRLRQTQEIYGTQCSFAITGPTLDGCGGVVLDNREKHYKEYMEGCYKHWSKRDCDNEEKDRHISNQEQPRSMINMTSTGFRKMKAPPELAKLLSDFWEINNEHKKVEYWGEGDLYTNHWAAPTYLVSVEDDGLVGSGERLKKAIWNAAIDGIAEWTGGVAKIRPVSLYGIREYTEGAVLSPHVDRVPLVSSGIVNVAQDVDEPWPLEVYDRNGHAVNVTMEPGDMILYESHSLIHGRPFPLKGRFYANIFIHFEPYDGWDNARDKTKLGDNNGDLPPYIIPGSPEEKRYRDENPNGWFKDYAEGEEPPVGDWASEGKLKKLQNVAKVDQRLLWFEDSNGWTPLHEAARSGEYAVVEYLVESGANINSRTNEDATALRIAINSVGEDHRVVKYLRELGAEDHGDVVDEYFKTDDEDEEEDDDWRQMVEEKESHSDAVPSENTHVESMIKRLEIELEREALEMEKRILAEVPTIVADDDEDL